MPTEEGELTAQEVADRLGIKASTWRGYVTRDKAREQPEIQPSKRLVGRPVWAPEVIDRWQQNRRGQDWRRAT